MASLFAVAVVIVAVVARLARQLGQPLGCHDLVHLGAFRKFLPLFASLLVVFFMSPSAPAQDFAWAKQLGGAGFDFALGVGVDTNGNVYTVGMFEGAVDFDPGPSTYCLTSAGNEAAFISKLDSLGHFVWAKQLGGPPRPGLVYASHVALDASGNSYIAGHFVGSVDFDPGPGTCNLTAASGGEGFVTKLDSEGNFLWARQLGSAGFIDPVSYGVGLDANGHVYVAGLFGGTADFDPGPGTCYLTATPGKYDVFIVKLDNAGNFTWARQLSGIATYDYPALAMAIDAAGNVETVGEFEGTADRSVSTSLRH